MTEIRPCPICDAGSEQSNLFLEKNIDPGKLTEFSFASRKLPEFMCHRLVQCHSCDLVYVDRPPSEDELADSYNRANYDSSEEADDAAAAYIQAIQPTLDLLTQRKSALEIGTGNGIFLEYLYSRGFSELVGVEPSSAAISSAPLSRQAWIHEGMFDEKNYTPETFDLVCCFMTMEHVRDPSVIASAVLRLLRPGGAFVTVTHDYRSLVNRLLGKHSPIIDIEHMQIFSKSSLHFLFRRVGYSNVTVNEFKNSYTLKYWLRLAPLPNVVKVAGSTLMQKTGVDNLKLSVNVGNVIACGFKDV